MNGYLGEEGQFGYLAASAGGVRKSAKKIKAENPIFKREEIQLGCPLLEFEAFLVDFFDNLNTASASSRGHHRWEIL